MSGSIHIKTGRLAGWFECPLPEVSALAFGSVSYPASAGEEGVNQSASAHATEHHDTRLGANMEIRSRPLDSHEIAEQIPALIGFFSDHGMKEVVAMYGVACNVPLSELFEEIRIPVDKLEDFINESVQRNVYQYGKADLFISDPAFRVTFVLSMQSDIRCKTAESRFMRDVRSRWGVPFAGRSRLETER